MELAVSQHPDGVAAIHVSGAVDVYTAAHLRTLLDGEIGRGHTRLVVDLLDVDFIDSTGLGVLVARLKAVRSQQGWIRLVIDNDKILRVLSITGLDQVFPLYGGLDQALANPDSLGS